MRPLLGAKDQTFLPFEFSSHRPGQKRTRNNRINRFPFGAKTVLSDRSFGLGSQDLLTPDLGIGEARRFDEPDSPGEPVLRSPACGTEDGGTRSTRVTAAVGPVPPPTDTSGPTARYRERAYGRGG